MSEKVFVQDKDGQPLMPTKPARARRKLEEGKAEVIQREPFTIRLRYKVSGRTNTQKVRLGVDSGYSKIGFSVITKDEELIAGEMNLKNDISRKLEQRRKYRRARRSRNTRYRKPRFNNRKKEEDWLAPSIRHKKDAHIRLVGKIKEILPITKVIIEVAKFDTQKLQNPEIKGKEYQQGTLQGYNLKNYLLEKFNYKCTYCGQKNIPLEIEHIVPRSRGGTNRVSNLAISCHECNQKKGNSTAEEFGHPEVQEKAEESLKEVAFMNQVRWKVVNELDCSYTFGYKTKKKRIELELEKSHVNDAFIIAGGDGQKRAEEYTVSRRKRNNRSIQMNRKDFGRSIRTKHYNLQPGDIIKKNDREARVKGMVNYGNYIRINHGCDNYWKNENVGLVKYGKGLQFS